MDRKISRTLEELLEYFPIIEPPLTVSDASTRSFSAQNKPIPAKLIEQLFKKWEEFDEFTEVVPCFQLKSFGNFSIIVYWKGGLLSYEFILLTLNDKAGIIAKKVIAGTLSNNLTVKESVAVIDKDLNIYCAVGESLPNEREFDPQSSSAYKFEILPDGTIHTNKEEEDY